MMNANAVDIKALVTVSEFERYMRPGGRPVVIRGWMESWTALEKWDFLFFSKTYGGDRLSLTYAEGHREHEMCVSMQEYIEYITERPAASRLLELEQRLRLRRPLYCLSYKPFRDHPELWDDFSIPPFVANWWPFFDESFRRSHFPQDQGWVLIGAKGSVAELHKDSHHTLTWLAQVRGRKSCYLFCPERSDPASETPYHCTLHPGEMLFLPPDWWHHVTALDHSITVSCNFVNHLNLGYYLRAAFGSRLPEVLAMLPGELAPSGAGGREQPARDSGSPSGDLESPRTEAECTYKT